MKTISSCFPILQKWISFQKKTTSNRKPLIKEKEFSQMVSKLTLQNFGCMKCFQLILELVFPKPSITKAK
jgi:hypothetical protein